MTHITSGTVFIWISKWEYQCCGTPINCGDVAYLTVCDTDCAEPWEAAVRSPIALAAEHHMPPEGSYHLKVRVERLMEARAHREQRPGDEARYLVPGSGEVCDVPTMKVWDEDWQPARAGGAPEGWILQVTVLAELPSQLIIRPEETDAPRLDDITSASPQGGEDLPLLAAWQPTQTVSRAGFLPGHPCIVTSLQGEVCTCLFVARGGLYGAEQPERVRDLVSLDPGQFLGRALELVHSDWEGFANPATAGSLTDYANLFPMKTPPHPDLM